MNISAILTRVPTERWGDAKGLGAVVFLASEASACVNGTILAVDGRRTGR